MSGGEAKATTPSSAMGRLSLRFGLMKFRMVARLKRMTGTDEDIKDGEFEEIRDAYKEMIKDTEELGAGISENLLFLRRYYENGQRLSALEASFWNGGDHDREAEFRALDIATEDVHERPELSKALQVYAERWAFVNTVVRRSAAAVIVEHALDPLRYFVTFWTGEFQRALDSWDAAQIEAQRKKLTEYERMEKRNAVHTRREATIDIIKKAVERQVLLVDEVGCAIAAAHAELLAQTSEYLDDSLQLLPNDLRLRFQAQMREVIKTGGPVLNYTEQSTAAKAIDVISGKKSVADFKREKIAAEKARRLQDEQLARAIGAEQEKFLEKDQEKQLEEVERRRNNIPQAVTFEEVPAPVKKKPPPPMLPPPPSIRQSAAVLKKQQAQVQAQAKQHQELQQQQQQEQQQKQEQQQQQREQEDQRRQLEQQELEYERELHEHQQQQEQQQREQQQREEQQEREQEQLRHQEEEGELQQLQQQAQLRRSNNSNKQHQQQQQDDQEEQERLREQAAVPIVETVPGVAETEAMETVAAALAQSASQAVLLAPPEAPTKTVRLSLVPMPPPEDAPSPKIMVALFDCEPDNDDELAFQMGDRMVHLGEADNPDWIHCKLDDDTAGLVPLNYLEQEEP